MNDAGYLQLAIDTAVKNVESGNGGPFGAVILFPNGDTVAVGNSVTTTIDPTAHAEVNAIRAACAKAGVFNLEGCVLYSSCEPCPMCLGAALWSRVDRIVFSADRYDAADAGFDDAAFYEKLAAGDVAERIILDNSVQPFTTWNEYQLRTEY